MTRNEKSVLITNIQRMCFHDGPGIRTTVFLKGCNLRCPWCANPENISGLPENYIHDGITGTYGRKIDQAELLNELLRDKAFFGNEGGVTFSGGEPLLHLENLESLIVQLKQHGINIVVETALQVSMEKWKSLLKQIDTFIIDLKILDKEMCASTLGGNIDIYRENVDLVYRNNKNMIFRIPLNHEYTMNDVNLNLIDSFLEEYNSVPVEIFATHSMGEAKYKSLGKSAPKLNDVTVDEVESIADRFRKHGILVRINSV